MNNAGRSANRRQVLESAGGERTLRILGAACGKRLQAAANALEQDPHLLVTLLGTAMLARLGDALNDESRVQQKLLALWQRSHRGAGFPPPWFHSNIQREYWRLWTRKFSARVTRRLERVLALFSRRHRRRAGEALRTREIDDALGPFLEIILGKVHARDATEGAHLRALTDGTLRWFRWWRTSADSATEASARRKLQEARWQRAMRLVADVLLARLLAEYDIPTPQDICYFVSGLLNPSAQDVPVPPPEDR